MRRFKNLVGVARGCESKIGKLDKAWDEAKAKGSNVVEMKQDWKKVFAFEP